MYDTKLDTSELSELGKAAVWYCENGFSIIPIRKRDKRPFSKNGLHDAFNNPEDAKKLWTMYPQLNIAIVCGKVSGKLIVLDFDEDDESGEHGSDTLADWEDEYGELPSTVTAITGRGGMHYLYRDTRLYHPSVNTDLGIDIRAEGSYIIAPPSIHPNGTKYSWNIGDAPWECAIAQVDDNVRRLIDYVQRNGGEDQDVIETTRFELPQRIKNGKRNDTLFRYGCSLRSRGESDLMIRIALEHANDHNCINQMDKDELDKLIKRVCKYGPGSDGEGTMIGAVSDIGAPGQSSTNSSSGSFSQDQSEFPPFRNNRGSIIHNELAKGIMRHDHARNIDGALAVWTGKKWEFGVNAIKKICTRHADDIKESQRTEVLKYISSSEHLLHVSSVNNFDNCFYIQFNNCTWDVLAECEVEPNHQMFITGTLPVDLDRNAPPGLADEFLDSVSDGDEQTKKVLCEIIGACMCSSQIISQAPMLIGRADGSTAANGKSTYINVLRALLGTGNVSTLDIAMFGKPFYIASLVGKLANLGDDIPASYLHGEEASVWKRAVTGDSIKADVKFGDPFEFEPRAVQVFSMNVVPRLSADDDGLYRRFAFVPFRRHFEPGNPDFDPHIIEKLTRPENLQRFALLGLMELPYLIMRGKLSQIDDMASELADVMRDNNVVVRWMDDEDAGPTGLDRIIGRMPDELYQSFKEWCKNAGERPLSIPNRSNFSKRLVAHFSRKGKLTSVVRWNSSLKKTVRVYDFEPK